jgi:hypothetical protein
MVMLVGALAVTACANPPFRDELSGHLFRVGPRYRVTACGTDDSFELRLATALRVNLDRRVEAVEAQGEGPIRAQLIGRALPPTRETAPTKLFDVWEIGRVEAGGCPDL